MSHSSVTRIRWIYAFHHAFLVVLSEYMVVDSFGPTSVGAFALTAACAAALGVFAGRISWTFVMVRGGRLERLTRTARPTARAAGFGKTVDSMKDE